jgi:hypothetical protein
MILAQRNFLAAGNDLCGQPRGEGGGGIGLRALARAPVRGDDGGETNCRGGRLIHLKAEPTERQNEPEFGYLLCGIDISSEVRRRMNQPSNKKNFSSKMFYW